MNWHRLSDKLSPLKMMTTTKKVDYLSTTPTSATTPSSTSQPDSLDLDYDMWQGQFEFVGPTVPINAANGNGSSSIGITALDKQSRTSSSSLEDLRLNGYIPPDQPVLIDEETFLSLHPNDFPSSGPQSGFFLDDYGNPNQNALETYQLNNNNLTANGNVSGGILNIKMLNNKTNNLISSVTIEEKNAKNNLINNNLKLINDNPELGNKYILKSSNSSSKMSDLIKTDLCDNLNEQLEILQRQVTNLADTQSNVDDRTSRTKTEYAVLQARYHMLEEQLRETELRAEERLVEEQKRHRELLARVEREAKLQNENCQIRIRTMEMEVTSLREEIQRLRLQSDKQAADLHATEEKLEKARDSLMISQADLADARAEEKKHRADKQAAEELMVELGKECERLRSERGPALPTTSPESLRLEELHQEMDELRQKSKALEEANEELQAMMLTRSIEEGRNLLNGTSNSLAQELEAMSQNQDTVDSTTLASLTQLQVAFQEKEEENRRLKHYIDTMLLNVVENYPQLLETFSSELSIIESLQAYQQKRMASGTDVAPSEVPYQVSFRFIEQDRHLGSGAILNVRFIITQASFIWKLMRTYPEQSLSEIARIRLGQVELKSKTDDLFYSIYSYTYHPEFDFEAARNDVALVRTREYIDFNRFVQPIELRKGPIPEGSIVSYTDWGAEKACTLYKKSWFPGNVGGPLVMIEDGRPQLVGVMSYVYRACNSFVPGGFERLWNHYEWIAKVTTIDYSYTNFGEMCRVVRNVAAQLLAQSKDTVRRRRAIRASMVKK
uniref:Peptidase S1 domain-containing protein n=1 Tax=Anopheles christyi TaxID=43041 RepID=A0A182K4P0_9DIPT